MTPSPDPTVKVVEMPEPKPEPKKRGRPRKNPQPVAEPVPVSAAADAESPPPAAEAPVLEKVARAAADASKSVTRPRGRPRKGGAQSAPQPAEWQQFLSRLLVHASIAYADWLLTGEPDAEELLGETELSDEAAADIAAPFGRILARMVPAKAGRVVIDEGGESFVAAFAVWAYWRDTRVARERRAIRARAARAARQAQMQQRPQVVQLPRQEAPTHESVQPETSREEIFPPLPDPGIVANASDL